MPYRIVLAGIDSPDHLGAHLLEGAREAGIEVTLVDSRDAWSDNKWVNRINFHLLQKRPARLRTHSARVVEVCRRVKPDLLLSTGIAPISESALRDIGTLGIARANFLTDDPWNSTKGARFFWPALLQYDTVFTCRRSHMADLQALGCRDVQFTWLAYNPTIHFSEAPADDDERRRYACEIAFVGGGDQTRRTLAVELLRAGADLKLYGGYWGQFSDTRAHYHGFAVGRELRLAVGGGLLNLCMGRAANRDGHALRTFELPAMGACMVVEDTGEHRELFGAEGQCVFYYRTAGDIVGHLRTLRQDPSRARRLAEAAQALIRTPDNTYTARLNTMLGWVLGKSRPLTDAQTLRADQASPAQTKP